MHWLVESLWISSLSSSKGRSLHEKASRSAWTPGTAMATISDNFSRKSTADFPQELFTKLSARTFAMGRTLRPEEGETFRTCSRTFCTTLKDPLMIQIAKSLCFPVLTIWKLITDDKNKITPPLHFQLFGNKLIVIICCLKCLAQLTTHTGMPWLGSLNKIDWSKKQVFELNAIIQDFSQTIFCKGIPYFAFCCLAIHFKMFRSVLKAKCWMKQITE